MYIKKTISITTFLILLTLCSSVFISCTKTIIEEKHIIVRDTLKVGSISAIVRKEGLSQDSRLPIFPYRGAKVSVKNQGGVVATDTTDALGYVCFSSIPEGDYQVYVVGKQENSLTFDVTVTKNEVSVLKNHLFDCVYLPDGKIEKKPWTFVHYGCLADMTSDLNRDFLWEFRLLEREGASGDRVNHVVYIPPTASQSIKSQIMYLQKPSYTIENEIPYEENFKDPILFSEAYRFDAYNYSDADPADYNVLLNSTRQISTLFPGDSVVLCVYDHGTGIDIAYPKTRSICGNAATQKEITVPQLRETLMALKQSGVKVHSLVLSACLMGVFEVAYELKDCGLKYILAAERQSTKGFYLKCAEWIEKLNNGEISLSESLMTIVKNQNRGNNYALYDMAHFGELNALFNDFSRKISRTDPSYIKPIVAKTIKSGAGSSGDMEYSCYDLGDFAKNVSEANFQDSQQVRAAAALLYQFIKVRNPGHFITVFNPANANPEIEKRGTGMGVLLRAPDHPYKGHNQDVYQQHKYYADGNTDWDTFLSNLDK